MSAVRIAVIGDYQPGVETHTAVADAVKHAAEAVQARAAVEWIATPDAERLTHAELRDVDGFWIAPGSPYRSMLGALRVIRFAREEDRPLLGTCGGFQHVILEHARDVLGLADAAHAEYDPYASRLFISALTCSLADDDGQS